MRFLITQRLIANDSSVSFVDGECDTSLSFGMTTVYVSEWWKEWVVIPIRQLIRSSHGNIFDGMTEIIGENKGELYEETRASA